MSNQDDMGYARVYARQVLAKAGVSHDRRLENALATVRRENFLGDPPWLFRDFGRYRELASSDPIVLYQDMLVTLDATREVNNGLPSLHAQALHRLGIREGETVVHLGAGSGYYTAIIAELVGPSGRVIGVEYDAALAERARQSLSGYGQASVVHGDALKWAADDVEADVVYVNFALDHPPPAWVENLTLGGRLLFPFGVPGVEAGRPTASSRWAAFLMIDRQPRGFGARFLAPVSFIWAEGQEPAPEGRHAALAEAFRTRGLSRVRSLRWRVPATGEEWYGEDDWGLSFDEV